MVDLVSSSEPRLTPPVANANQRELTGEDLNVLRSNVPFTTHVLLVGSMLLFFLIATLITLQSSWEWWIIPAVVAVPVVVVLTQRYRRVQKAREARLRMEAEMRSAGSKSGPAGRQGTGR